MKFRVIRADGRDNSNEKYLVVNVKEPYAGIVADLIEAEERYKGTWEHGNRTMREIMGIPIMMSASPIEYYLQRVWELKTVVEAAQEFLDTIDLAERTGADVIMPPVQWRALYRLREALAALDDDKCRNCGAPFSKCGPALWKKGKKCCPECAHTLEPAGGDGETEGSAD